MNAFRSSYALAALLFSTLGALAGEVAADQPSFTDINGCKAVTPEKIRGAALKVAWNGACVDGLISGKGTLQLGPNKFTGEFKRGQLVSGGKVTGRANTSYVGEFVDNTAAGRGVYRDEEVTITAVFAKEGPTIGPAVVEWFDGTRYEGTLNEHRLMEWKGRLVWSNGDSYEGEFLNDFRHGTGTCVSPTGWSYTGQWARGQPAGRGIELHENGGRYEGEFKAGMREGQGRQTEVDGSVLEGDWKAGQLNGHCKIREALGHNYEGMCAAGGRSGHGRYENAADGSVYEGDFKDSLFHGQGRMTAEGYVYEGAYALGMKNGRGREVFDTGEQYEGDFVRGERSGKGILRIAGEDGTTYSYDGMFKNGVFAGQGKLSIGAASLEGEFKAGSFLRGVVHTQQGKTIEVDNEKQTYFEVLQDGTKVPVDPSALMLPPTR
jgi:hypothetical protein